MSLNSANQLRWKGNICTIHVEIYLLEESMVGLKNLTTSWPRVLGYSSDFSVRIYLCSL